MQFFYYYAISWKQMKIRQYNIFTRVCTFPPDSSFFLIEKTVTIASLNKNTQRTNIIKV